MNSDQAMFRQCAGDVQAMSKLYKWLKPAQDAPVRVVQKFHPKGAKSMPQGGWPQVAKKFNAT